MTILTEFEKKFNNIIKPDSITSSEQLSHDERSEVMAFSELSWRDIDCKLLEKHFEVINWFSPAAFRYFLPGICYAGIRENKPELLIYDSIIDMLDRSQNIDYWDDFFLQRWTLFNSTQCDVLQEWVCWFSENTS